MTKAEINEILKFGKFKDINHFYETHPNQNDEHTKQFMSEYKAYCNGGKIGMKDGGNIKPPKKEISLSGGLFGINKLVNKDGGWDSFRNPNSYMTANGKVNYSTPLNKNSNAFFKGSVGTANFLSRLEPDNYLQRDNNGNLTYDVAPEGYENENDFIASARLGMQTPQQKKFNRFTDHSEISAGLDYANGNIYPGAGFNYSADYNFKRKNSLSNTQYNKTAGSVGVYGDVNIAPFGIGKEIAENYAGTDSSSEYNQAMRTNLGVKAQYNFPKNGFFVRGNAEINPLITNSLGGVKTLPNAQLTIGQRFNNGGNIKSRLPKYNLAGTIDVPLTNEQVLANLAPGGNSLEGINQSLGFYKTPGNAPVKTPGQGADFSQAANSVAQIGAGIVDSTTENDSVGGAAAKKGLNWAGTAASVALRPEVLAATGGFSALAIPVAGGIGAVLGGTDQIRENKYADFQNSADKRRRQNSLYNPNPYGMDSSYTMNAANGGNIGPSNIKNYYADGGEMVNLSSDAVQVEGDEPQQTDGVIKRDDRTGQPIAMVDHNEVIKDGQQVFSDEKKISKKAGLTRTFAKTAEILAKQKGKLETQLEKRGGEDVYTANAIKAVDRQMNSLFGLQERTATQMGLREPAPQQAMAMRSGGNLKGYANGGEQPWRIQDLMKLQKKQIPGLTNNLWNPEFSTNSHFNFPSMWNTVEMQKQLEEETNNNSYNTPFNSPINFPINTTPQQQVPNNSVNNTNNINSVFNPTVPINSIGNNIVAPKSNTVPTQGITPQQRQELEDIKPLRSRLTSKDGKGTIYDPKLIIDSTTGKLIDANTTPGYNQRLMDSLRKRDANKSENPTYPKSSSVTEDRRAYDPDENLLLSGLGNAAELALLGRSEIERAVFDPYESRTANYINNMPTNTNIRASLNELNKQRRLMQLQASQNSPTIAAAANSDIFSAAADSENKLRQDADNLNNQMRRERAVMQAQNSANAGAKWQAAINKANLETAQNKGATDTNRMAILAKQTENQEKAWNYSNDKSLISNVLEFHDVKGGFFKTDALIQDNNAVNSFLQGYLNMTPEQRKQTKKELRTKSSKSKETNEFINELPD